MTRVPAWRSLDSSCREGEADFVLFLKRKPILTHFQSFFRSLFAILVVGVQLSSVGLVIRKIYVVKDGANFCSIITSKNNEMSSMY